MLARRLPSILPPLTREEAIEVTRIHSVAGASTRWALVTERPFRAPHHAVSASAMVGGGPCRRPARSTLAHHGVLFLDELSEFPRPRWRRCASRWRTASSRSSAASAR